MADAQDRAREEFFSEAQEIVEGLGRDLLGLDEGQRTGRVDAELVNDLFRAVHTLKGLAGLFGANRMSTLSHELEGLLDDMRLGRVELTPTVLDLLFRSAELYDRILQNEKEGRDQAMPEVDDLIRELHRGKGGAPPPSPIGHYELDPGLLAVLTEYEEHRLRTNIAQGLTLFRLRVQFQLATIDQALDDLKAAAKPHGEIITYLPTGAGADADSIELDILMACKLTGAELEVALALNGVAVEEVARRPVAAVSSSPVPFDRGATAEGAAGTRVRDGSEARRREALDVASLLPPQMVQREAGGAGPKVPLDVASIRSVAQTVRVDIQKLDRLMNIVGELAIVKSSLTRLSDRLRAAHISRELSSDLHRLQRTFDRHLESMQKGILEVRMVPLGQVFDKLARVVRQISRDADKHVNLVITGAETEVDKLIVEELSDPLMHMMRNAIDHGIESRSAREAVGKPAMGTIALNAFQKGNHVVIEIEDDGGGIDTDRLLDAAVRRGVLAADEARTSSRREVLNLVFIPGMTTKSDVSELSGRGVGMDVVKTNISKLGGVIDLGSERGIGTKVTITLPITLAIISALLVDVAGRTFALPLANVQEAIVLEPDAVRRIDDREVVTLRGTTLPLCFLGQLFELDGSAVVGASPGGAGAGHAVTKRNGKRFVVVVSVGSRKLGLVVDTLIGEQDVVIKALGASLKSVRGFAGATELGDQRIGLVLDAPALLEELSTSPRDARQASEARDG
ncbi:MAG: chemotaxis protein CheA [Polyangiaceae bacterium]